jgi:hypothetical protein
MPGFADGIAVCFNDHANDHTRCEVGGSKAKQLPHEQTARDHPIRRKASDQFKREAQEAIGFSGANPPLFPLRGQ